MQASSYIQRHRPQQISSTLMSRAHALLDDSSSNDKTDGWCLDTDATHVIGRREFFTELDFDV
jgi:hypothetical protein